MHHTNPVDSALVSSPQDVECAPAGGRTKRNARCCRETIRRRARVRQLQQLEMPFRSPVARCRPSTYTLAYVYKDTRSYRLGRSAISPSLSLSAALFLAGGWIQFMILQTRIVGSFTGGVCVCVSLSAVQYIIYYITISYIIIFGLVFCRRPYNISTYIHTYCCALARSN